MSTYLDMQTRIMDELDRPNLGPQVKKAIITAVAFYARKGFYGTDATFTFNTVVGQEYYGAADNAAIATSPDIDILNININAGRMELDKKLFEYIDDISFLPTATGMPTMWAYRAEQIRLYPIPSQIWVVTAFNTPRLTELSGDTDSNFWTDTNGAEALIRARAKLDLILNVIRGVDMADEIAGIRQQEMEERAALFTEAASREATGILQPTCF